MSYTKEQKRSVFNKLPQKIREVLVSDEFVSAIKNVAKTNMVPENVGDLLVVFISDVLMGIENKNNLKEKFAQHIKDPVSIEKITSDIEVQILKNIDALYIEILNNFKKEEEENGRDFDVNYYIESLENTEYSPTNTQEKLSDYLKNNTQTVNNDALPAKQDFILKNSWEKITHEIAEKYSLNEEQTENLIKIVLIVLLDPEKQKGFLEKIVSDLKISKLLAEQITEDLEARIFEPGLKIPENQGTGVPELRPIITPMIEPQEKVRVRPVPVGFTGATPQPAPKPQMPAPELVQRPISVPRYTAVPMEEERNSSQGIVASSKETPKPNEVTSSQPASAPQPSVSSPQPVPEPVKKYAVDPYREPLE